MSKLHVWFLSAAIGCGQFAIVGPAWAQTADTPREKLPPPVELPMWTKAFYPEYLSNEMGKSASEDPQGYQNSLRAEAYIRGLRKVPEVRFNATAIVKDRLAKRTNHEPAAIAEFIANDPAFAGFPWCKGNDCQVAEEEARRVVDSARLVHSAHENAWSGPVHKDPQMKESEELRARLYWADLQKLMTHSYCDPSRLLYQIVQAEVAFYRMMMVELLDKQKGKEATEALAKLAIFDMDERIRARAIIRLSTRPLDEAMPAFKSGFRHLWQPAATHAAEALMQLRNPKSLGELVTLLDEPDPARPFQTKEEPRTIMIRELVRLNHNHNCIVCHAPTLGMRNENLIAVVPSTNKPLPVFGLPGGSAERYSNRDPKALAIRFDITYLRPEFSTKMDCLDDDRWPLRQRYDFITRVRFANDKEIAAAREKQSSYPQREAVLRTLRDLTGRDGGDDLSEWKRIAANVNRD